MKNLIRKNVSAITPYIASKPIEETKRELGLKKIIKLDANENPLGASPKAIAAMRKRLSTVNRYPDNQGFYLKAKLAEYLSIEPANIVLGNGSDELIDVVIKTFVEEAENIATADITFLEYKIISEINNHQTITAPLKNFKYDLEAIKKKIDKKIKLVFIANPNNPTGTYVTISELENFMRDLPADVVLVLDEAYDTFIDVDDFPKGQNYIMDKNVIVLKTFSKAYGLAGLRIGYSLAKPEFTSYMERVRQPFNVNALAQAAATAALDDKDFLLKTRATVQEGKKYLYDSLKELGLSYVPSVANFILVNASRNCKANENYKKDELNAISLSNLEKELYGKPVSKKMLEYGVVVRDMEQYGLKNFIRVTVGRKEENERFIEVLKKIF
ncbi:MAG: histidinol-phosphate transaminase [Candidatus Aenigmarchaeota archaeon]|nr:histidinol-phosphate transaminase [Candidatus Aenigmarchaeota archaeon]